MDSMDLSLDAQSFEQRQQQQPMQQQQPAPQQLQPLAPSQPLQRRDLPPLRSLQPLGDGSPALGSVGGGLGARRLRALEASPNPGGDAFSNSGLVHRGHAAAAAPAPSMPAQRLDFGVAPAAPLPATGPQPLHSSQLHPSRDPYADEQRSRRSSGGTVVAPPPHYGEERERRGSGGGGGGGPHARHSQPSHPQQQHHHHQPQHQHQQHHTQPAQPAQWESRGPAPYNPDPASSRRGSGGDGRFDGRESTRFSDERQRASYDERRDGPLPLQSQQQQQWQRPAHMRVDEEDGGYNPRNAAAAVDSSMRFHASAGAEGFYGNGSATGHPAYPPSNAASPLGQQQHEREIVSPSAAPGAYYGRDDRGPAPPSNRMPSTPMRATFSPHASKLDPHAPAKDTESGRAKGAEKAPVVLMTTVEELLSPAALQRYQPLFARIPHSAGFGPLPLAAILDLDDKALDALLDQVDAEGEAVGVELTLVHREQIVWRVKQEREKRILADPHRRRQMQLGVPVDRELGRGGALTSPGGTAAVAAGGSDVGGNTVVLDGMRGLLRHWCCCLGICVFSLLVAIAFLLLYSEVGVPAMDRSSSSGAGGGGVNGGSVSSATSGGWKFLYILSILGFILGGLAALMAVLSWVRNPATRSCNCASFWASCRALERPKCPDCGDCCSSCGSCGDCDCCPALGCGGCMGEMRSCLRECGQGIREQCHLPECPECDCGGCGCAALAAECGCADCASPNCSCKECCPDCAGCGDCGDCAGCGDDCCKCEAPSCDCDCCPDCEGDIKGCCSVLYKVCCCQCKIQVA